MKIKALQKFITTILIVFVITFTVFVLRKCNKSAFTVNDVTHAAFSNNIAFFIGNKYISKPDILKIDDYGFNAIHAATTSGSYELVKYLIETYQIQLNELDFPDEDFKQTPIVTAAQQNNENLIMYFFNLGCDPFSVDIMGKNAIDYAIKNKNKNIANILIDK